MPDPMLVFHNAWQRMINDPKYNGPPIKVPR
jgi:hypothetical protein